MKDKRNTRNTKGKIISAAWKLFYEQGYENTTIEDIISESRTSRGSFYHYFEGKDALLGTLAYVFDEKYEEIRRNINEDLSSAEKLCYLNHELFVMIEDGISRDLLARLLSTQLLAQGEKSLLDRNRTYFKLIRKIVLEGKAKGELRSDMTENEITRSYALWERALLYDWCLCGGEYSLSNYSDRMTPVFIQGLQSVK
ncbi:MAG TPA: TetR/AcrR family transcriptional regulator [Lachnospiraceae bacterium]|nr:TetR/AcrR family transcriptional regulator [Lachnospiraceae bacterium]